jgi:hypothetical protein
MSEVFFRCKTKATDREGDQLRWSLNWALARRAEIRFTELAIECGDWTIPYESIEDAVLLVISMGKSAAYNIRVKSKGKTYNFALKSTSARGWKHDPFRIEEAPFSIRRKFARFPWCWLPYIDEI